MGCSHRRVCGNSAEVLVEKCFGEERGREQALGKETPSQPWAWTGWFYQTGIVPGGDREGSSREVKASGARTAVKEPCF